MLELALGASGALANAMLSPDQQERFVRQGLLNLQGFLPADKVAAARAATMRAFDAVDVGNSAPVAAPGTPHKGKLRSASESRPVRDLFTVELMAVIVGLAGGRSVQPMGKRAQHLVTMPNADEWTVPSTVWHVDLPRLPCNCLVGIQVFTFLSRVSPQGGATLVVAGSHRLLNNTVRLRSKDIKRRLRRLPYFRDLLSGHCVDRERFLTTVATTEDPAAGEVPLRVVELHGRPGDVWLTDMRLLHTLAPNATRRPRIMLTHRFLIQEFANRLWEK